MDAGRIYAYDSHQIKLRRVANCGINAFDARNRRSRTRSATPARQDGEWFPNIRRVALDLLLLSDVGR